MREESDKVGKGQSMQDLESHGKEFGLYSKWKGWPTKGLGTR